MYVATRLIRMHCVDGANVRQTSSIIPGDGFWNNVTIEDVMSTTGGRLCYIYA